MATFSSVTQQHVLQAIAEYDTRGGEEFLELYGFAPVPEYAVVHEGSHYDLRAILGVAHRFATGRLASPDEFHDDLPAAAAILRRRGFEVSVPYVAAPVAPQRATRAPRAPRATTPRTPAVRTPAARAAAERDNPPAICPTCSMTLPATGVCDSCF